MIIDLTPFRLAAMSASEFAERAFTLFGELHATSGFHRRHGEVKSLIEEILPLATFVKYYDAPERRVRCRYRGGRSERLDAELFLSGEVVRRGFHPRLLRVEVTVAAEKRAYLQRELMALGKTVFLGPGIRRTGSRHLLGTSIENYPVAQEGGRGAEECAALVREAVSRKAARIGRRKRLLVVSLEPESIMRTRDWRRLAELAFDESACSRFLAVFVVEVSSGTVLQVA